MKKVVSVFGSSAPRPGSEGYETARKVGRLLAEAGFAVATGGYGGTMTAVSQGASEAGGLVIGVASTRIERYRGAEVNQWVEKVVRYDSLNERLLHLVTQNDAMIALPGGIGTLSEVALAWSLMQVGEAERRPFALVGEMWPQTIQAMFNPAYVAAKDMELLYFAPSPETAVTYITQSLNGRE